MENPIIENIIYSGWETELNKLGSVLDNLAIKAESINISAGGKNGKVDTASQKELIAIMKQYNDTVAKLADVENRLNEEKKKRIVLSQQEKVERQSSNMVSKLEEQATNKNIDALTRLNAQHKLAAINYANLSQKVGVTSSELNIARNKMVETTEALMKLNTGTVGVKSGMNNAYNSTFQMTQVMRELPNFAIDARIGLMSISNNLPMLYDGFAQLSKQIDATTGKQKGWGYAFKTMGASLLSVNTVLILGMTLLMTYGSQIGAFISQMFKGKEAAGSFASQMKAVHEVIKDGSAKSALQEYAKLGNMLDLAKQGAYDSSIAVSEYNKTLGVSYGKVTDLNGALAGYLEYGNDYITSTIAMAAATNVMSGAADAFARKYEAQRGLKGLSNLADLNSKYLDLHKKLTALGLSDQEIYKRIGQSDVGLIRHMDVIDDLLDTFKKNDNGKKYIGFMHDMQKANIDLVSSQNTAKGLMKSVSIDFLKGQDKPDKTTKALKDTVVQASKERFIEQKYYDEQRAKIIKTLSLLEDKITNETTDGIKNSFEDRQHAAKAYYDTSMLLAKSERDGKISDAEQEYKRLDLSIKKDLDTNEKKHKNKKITDDEYIKADKSLKKSLETIQHNYDISAKEATDNYNKEQTDQRIKLSQNLLSIDKDRYADELKNINISEDEKIRIVNTKLEQTKNDIEKSGLESAFAKAFGIDEDLTYKNLQSQHKAAMDVLDIQKNAIIDKLYLTKQGSEDEENLLDELAKKEMEISDTTTQHKIDNERYYIDKTKEGYEEIGDALEKLIDTGLSAYFDVMDKRLEAQAKDMEKLSEKELDILDKQHEEGLISTEEYESEKASKEAYYQSVQDDIERQQLENEKRQKKLQIGMDLATGIMKAWSKYADIPPIAIALTALLTGTAAMQISAIDAQEYADGGLIELGNGKIKGSPNISPRTNGDNMKAYVTIGETILNKDQVASLGGAWAMKQAGVPGYEDASYMPDMRDVGINYYDKNKQHIIVNANFESEKIVKELRDIKASIFSKPRLMDSLKIKRYGN